MPTKLYSYRADIFYSKLISFSLKVMISPINLFHFINVSQTWSKTFFFFFLTLNFVKKLISIF